MNTLEMLEDLSQGWDVTLTSHELGPSERSWTLVITSIGAYGDRFCSTYRGTLKSVVSRAWAGERGDG